MRAGNNGTPWGLKALVWVLAAAACPVMAQAPLNSMAPVTRPGKQAKAPEVAANLQYFGGPVVSNIVTVSVLWGPNVDPAVAGAMPAFLRDLTNSSYMDWLCEYNTLGLSGTTTNQAIGRGSFGGQFTITPQHTAALVDDTDIQAELAHQLQIGSLPQPQVDAQGYPLTLYIIEFPPGVTISDQGAQSCVSFCAYHSSVVINGKTVLYAVQPDYGPSSGCAGGCGNAGMLENQESSHSHQIVETVTDPEVGINSLGWYDNNLGEIGDICNAEQAPLTVNGHTYTVQKEWSNRLSNCVTGNPYLASAPSIGGTSSVTAGGTISLTATGGTTPYEWLFDPGTGAQVIPGQTSASLTLASATSANAGTYWVSSKGSCTAQSEAWPVTVTTYGLTFIDDAGVAELCVNTTTGAYQFSILTGKWAGQTFTGTGAYTVTKGVGTFKTPPSAKPHIVAHDFSGTRGKVQFSNKSPHITIHFKDSNLADDTPCS